VSAYSAEFYAAIAPSASSSADVLVPLLLELVQPTSVVDVGCATGVWLAAFERAGVSRILGLDGEWPATKGLAISRQNFLAVDLTRRVELASTFDLALCLEVAEHLPESSADDLVDTLVGLAPAVAFSAAIPGQGGHHHVNEQWPDYWGERFRARDYVAFDCIRPRVWNDPAVAPFYAQNTLLYVSRRQRLTSLPPGACHPSPPLALVHPAIFEARQRAAREWCDLLARAAAGLGRTVPPGSPLIVLDGAMTAGVLTAGFQAAPFPQENGVYCGPLADAGMLIEQFELQRRTGARYFAVLWPAFWWLTHYADFGAHLSANHTKVFEDDSIRIFSL
jgi:SAM-dependent methyltransferase